MANVILFNPGDSAKPVAFGSTDSLGNFQLQAGAAGRYIFKLQLIGFEPQRLVLDITDTDLDLGLLDMKMVDQTLKEVTVTAWKKMITRTNSGFNVQTDAVLTQAAGTATDLLANIPTLLVDAEGGISIRGKSPLILINGRNSNLAGNLDRIPASSIERVEIINNPGARYDADAEGGVINIVLKKNAQNGTNAAFALGGGWGAHERFNGSFMLNNRTDKLNLAAQYDNRWARRTRTVETDRETFAATDNHFLVQRRSDERWQRTNNVKFNADYTPTEKEQVSLEFIYGSDWDRSLETLNSKFRSITNTFNSGNIRVSDERQTETNLEGSVNYDRKFADPRKKLSLGLAHSYGDEIEQTEITTTAIDDGNKPVSDPYLQRTRNAELTNITNLRADLSLPLSQYGSIETGYKGILRDIRANFLNANVQNGVDIPNPALSNIFDFNEDIHAVYGTYKYANASSRWRYEAGLRLEQMSNRGENNKAPSFRNSFFNFFPSLNLGYKLTDDAQLRLNIGRRINRPWLGQLNPFLDITDSLNQSGGNPNLKPELVNTFELGWGYDWQMVNISVNGFHRRGTNTIMPITELQPNGVTITRPQNVGRSFTTGAESFLTVNTGKLYNGTASISLFWQEVDAGNVDPSLSNSMFSWYVKWVNNLSVGKNTRLQMLFNYQAPTAIPQGERIAVYNMDLGVQQKIMKGKGRIGLTVTDVFNTLENGNVIRTEDFTIRRISKSDTRAILLTFAMTFRSPFREKLMENKFSAE